MTDFPSSPSPVAVVVAVVCDVCQTRQAIVTLGCVDYCARCAPIWHPSFEDVDE